MGLSRVVLLLAVLAGGCTSAPSPPPVVSSSSSPAPPYSPPPAGPSWIPGADPLPLRPDGYGEVLPTPPALVNRSLPTVDHLPPPTGDRYEATVDPVPETVLRRSTWRAACPVGVDDLRYLTMSFWGFDGRAHTGEMIVARTAATDVTRVFKALYDERFPLEEMRVVQASELAAAPTGDGNNTTAFVCRPAVLLGRWSAHARGLAVDVNPFHNPYVRDDLVLPELASSYVDRANVRPGMILPGATAVRAFAAIGWRWGGEWSTPLDLQHFSATGD
ncbi:M15 family metallopeptidase [Actinophytocola sp.]|uniref:M15 family metallopeptidase n=1 Tax=Actinophytocola sp. TaxID=1872138 RepID=UPI00345BFC97